MKYGVFGLYRSGELCGSCVALLRGAWQGAHQGGTLSSPAPGMGWFGTASPLSAASHGEPPPGFAALRFSAVPSGSLQWLLVHLAIPKESRMAEPSPPRSLPSERGSSC